MSKERASGRPRQLPNLPPLCVATLGGFWLVAYQRERLKLRALDDLNDLRYKDAPLSYAIGEAESAILNNMGRVVDLIRGAGVLLRLPQEGGAA